MKQLFNKKIVLTFLPIIAFVIIGGFLFFGNTQAVFAGDTQDNNKSELSCSIGGIIFSGGGNIIPCILWSILQLVAWILGAAVFIFSWAASAKTLTDVINGSAIYSSWQLVCNLFNMAFIMTLLYTAFTIIFQVDKTNKKIILTVVLMALLVNFSFPITRFIIDVGNTLMYTIFNTLFSGQDNIGILNSISAQSQLGTIVHPKGDPTIVQLIASIIFVGLLAITYLMMAMLFVIRIVALALVIIFSPIAFVGAILPSAMTSKIDWWGNLFKYTFFGPAMAFMLYISTKIIATTIEVKQGVTNFEGNAMGNEGILTTMGTFAIPLVVLWIGMGVAQKMGIEGAAMIEKYGKDTAKWAGKAPWEATGIPGGFKKAKDYYVKKGAPRFFGKIPGLRGEDATQATEDKIAGFLTKGKKGWNAAERITKTKRIKEKVDELEKMGTSMEDAKSGLDSKNEIDKIANAMYLNKKDKIGDYKTYSKVRESIESISSKSLDSDLKKEYLDDINFKAKKNNNVSFLIDYDIKINNKKPSVAYKEYLDKLSPQKLAEQKNLLNRVDLSNPDYDKNFHRYMFDKKHNSKPFIANATRFMTETDRKSLKKGRIIK